MTAPAFHFEAKKYALRQAKDGVIVSFVLHPDDVVPELLSAPIGEHYVVALAPYEKAAEEAEQQPAPDPEKMSHASSKLSVQAFWMCRRRDFQEWLGVTGEDAANARVKSAIDIMSKTALDHNRDAAQRWRDLVDEFHAATMPQERPA